MELGFEVGFTFDVVDWPPSCDLATANLGNCLLDCANNIIINEVTLTCSSGFLNFVWVSFLLCSSHELTYLGQYE